MKTILSFGALLLAATLSLPAHAAPGDELGARLDRACVSVPAVPSAAGLSLVEHGRAVDAYAAAIARYQDCLYQELSGQRASLTQSEQAMIAGRLSRSTYDLNATRQQYASAVRAGRLPMQVAETFP